MNVEIRHEPEQRRFVADVDGRLGLLEYRPAAEGTLDYYRTYVPPALRGRGLGGELARHALSYARTQGLRIVPSCSFVAAFLDEHPEFLDVVAEGQGRPAPGRD